jgi:hypothetical protein
LSGPQVAGSGPTELEFQHNGKLLKMPDTGGPTTIQLQKQQLFERTLKVTGLWN